MNVFKKVLSIFLIGLLVFYQTAFYIPVTYAQEATPVVTETPTPTEAPSPAPIIDPSPTATSSATPEPEATPTPEATPSATPEATPSATPETTPIPEATPSTTPIADPTPSTESASLSANKTPLRSAGNFLKETKKHANKNYVEGEVIVKFKK